MRKILIVILIAIFSLSIVACSSTEDEEGVIDNKTDTNNVVSENNDSSLNDINKDTDTKISDNEITFTESTVIDNDNCSIKITGIEKDNFFGYTLKTSLENKSSEKNYMFTLDSATVNGVQTNPLFVSEVVAGKKANEEIMFMDEDLEENGIDKFTVIELNFRVYDSDDWTAENVVEETVWIYPFGEENATNFIREKQPTDNIIVDNEYVTVTITGYDNDKIWGYTANLFIENKTDIDIMFSTDNVSINGYMVDSLFAEVVIAGKSAFSSISWSETNLEDNGIEEVEEIELSLRAYNVDDFMGDDLVNEVITLNP